jgi:ABC-2 type transport system permease protein/lipopolysaccharide transport system permease protein
MTLRRLVVDVREMLSEQREYRELLAQMTRRDLLLRYKQAAMGVGWALFMPLTNTVIFSVIFMRVAPIDTGLPYPLFAYCGLLVWNFLASSLRFSVSSLTSNSNLVTKVYCPREIFPFSAVLVSLADLAVGFVVLAALMLYYGIAPGLPLLALPIVIVVQVLFTAGVALVLAMANLFYRDVKYLFEVVITIWMFSTSVLFPIQLIEGWPHWLLLLNPMTPIIDAYRAVILGAQWPDVTFLAAALVAILTLGSAWLMFHRAESSFAENI